MNDSPLRALSSAELNKLSQKTLDAAFRAHSALGPGLLEIGRQTGGVANQFQCQIIKAWHQAPSSQSVIFTFTATTREKEHFC